MKIVSVIGARPQFIKAAPVSRALRNANLSEVVIHTGQHYDSNMSDIFFDQLEIDAPQYHLGIGSGPHGQQTGRMMEKLEQVLMSERPDWVLVYGDTNTTVAGALAAAKLHIPVAHVEAGLRSFNRRMPEEVNRVVTDHLSALLFAPTDVAVNNLQHEGISAPNILRVGDVMLDAALMFAVRAEERSSILQKLGRASKSYVLATIHRAENTDEPARLATIIKGLAKVCYDISVVLPLHPRTKKLLGNAPKEKFIAAGGLLIEPVGYLDMIKLERNASVIVTDSGGVQKEAFFYRVPCVTLRDETEWSELVELGWNKLLTPSDPEAIYNAICNSVGQKGREGTPYGNGRAAQLIAEQLMNYC